MSRVGKRTIRRGRKQMTLEEAIIHAEDVAEWLKLLKRILDSGDCNDCAMLHRQCRYAPRIGELVRYNCPFYSQESEG